ncbi:peroxisomal nicotinamide adenine dinucleotide carrier-like [Populus alba x Populus x berolinensis]|nr:peroxisomal nicotinamide adenine dinucleotide carrier-like [Populus alba x Populus x berolinensis]
MGSLGQRGAASPSSICELLSTLKTEISFLFKLFAHCGSDDLLFDAFFVEHGNNTKLAIRCLVKSSFLNSKKSQLSHPSIAPAEKVLDPIEPPPYGTGHATQELYDEAGIWGFWKGVFPTLIMVSNPSIQFMLYETMLKKLKTKCALVKQGDTGVSALEIFLLGALAKLGATVVTYPLLVVKINEMLLWDANATQT